MSEVVDLKRQCVLLGLHTASVVQVYVLFVLQYGVEDHDGVARKLLRQYVWLLVVVHGSKLSHQFFHVCISLLLRRFWRHGGRGREFFCQLLALNSH